MVYLTIPSTNELPLCAIESIDLRCWSRVYVPWLHVRFQAIHDPEECTEQCLIGLHFV